MATLRFMRLIVVIGALLTAGSTLLYIEHVRRSELVAFKSLTASNTFLGPVPGKSGLVQVQVIVRDSPDLSGLQIVSVEFDGKKIPLKPRDIYGNRGEASFQLRPGKYRLRWKVNRDTFAWPRTIKHEEEVTISARDLWLQLYIEGETASIR